MGVGLTMLQYRESFRSFLRVSLFELGEEEFGFFDFFEVPVGVAPMCEEAVPLLRETCSLGFPYKDLTADAGPSEICEKLDRHVT